MVGWVGRVRKMGAVVRVEIRGCRRRGFPRRLGGLEKREQTVSAGVEVLEDQVAESAPLLELS